MKALRNCGVALVVTALAGGATACSSSGSSTPKSASAGSSTSSPSSTAPASSGTTTAATPAAGKPIVIGLPNSDNGGGFSDYGVADGFEAWAKVFNAHGGLGGRPVQFLRCNDQGSTAVATQCVRTQLANPNVVLGTGFSPFASVIEGPSYLAAHVPWLSTAGNSAADINGKAATLCILPKATASFQAIPTYAIEKLGVKKVSAISLDVPALALAQQEIRSATAAAGGKVVSVSKLPFTAADFSAPIQQAISGGAQLLVAIETIPNVIKIIQTAASLGYTGYIAFGSGTLNSDVQKAINKATTIKFLTDSNAPDPTANDPAAKAFRDGITAYGKAGDITRGETEEGWMSAQYLQKLLESLGPNNISRASLTTAMTTKTIASVPMFDGPVGVANAPKQFKGFGYTKTHIATIDNKGLHIATATVDVRQTTAQLPAA